MIFIFCFFDCFCFFVFDGLLFLCIYLRVLVVLWLWMLMLLIVWSKFYDSWVIDMRLICFGSVWRMNELLVGVIWEVWCWLYNLVK